MTRNNALREDELIDWQTAGSELLDLNTFDFETSILGWYRHDSGTVEEGTET